MCNDETPLKAGYSDLPDHGKPSPPLAENLLNDLLIANRILAKYRVVDAFGHVSIRHPDNPERYVLCRNMAPALVTAPDLIEFDLDSNPVNAAGRPVYLERFLHGEIYRALPATLRVHTARFFQSPQEFVTQKWVVGARQAIPLLGRDIGQAGKKLNSQVM